MTVYHINQTLAASNSGVEFAQKYRQDILDKSNQFIFMNFQGTNLYHSARLFGMDPTHLISAFHLLANRTLKAPSLTLEHVLANYPEFLVPSFEDDHSTSFLLPDKSLTITYAPGTRFVEYVSLAVNGKVKTLHYYDDSLSAISQYNEELQLVSRQFFNDLGQLSLSQTYSKTKYHIGGLEDFWPELTEVDGQLLIGRDEFYQAFWKKLDLSQQDIIVFDRPLNYLESYLPIKTAKIAIVVHAEHYFISTSTQEHIVWNDFYDFSFRQFREIDAFICSTEVQKAKFDEAFLINYGEKPYSLSIPVGQVNKIIEAVDKNPLRLKFMTASRLSHEKNLDRLVQAFKLASEKNPDISLDIYGSGVEHAKLQELISENASIKLMGEYKMDGIYQQYGSYLTMSPAEGFGLSLLEAVGSYLPIIGLDVPYGNQNFVQSHTNGILIEDFSDVQEQISAMADAILQFVEKFDYQASDTYTKVLIQEFTAEKVAEKWNNLFKKLTD